uniref:Uncharacterized protein n=1 Tax=Rhizophora mucronata TaxID=61149 RepID=A0A2P2J3X7_RHIMU
MMSRCEARDGYKALLLPPFLSDPHLANSEQAHRKSIKLFKLTAKVFKSRRKRTFPGI